MTAEKHDAFISPNGDGTVIMDFSGKELIKGEPDGSSFTFRRHPLHFRGERIYQLGSYFLRFYQRKDALHSHGVLFLCGGGSGRKDASSAFYGCHQ